MVEEKDEGEKWKTRRGLIRTRMECHVSEMGVDEPGLKNTLQAKE